LWQEISPLDYASFVPNETNIKRGGIAMIMAIERPIIVIGRHADCESLKPNANPYTGDLERPLNEAGISQSELVGDFLKSMGFVPDEIYCSPALRAKQTVEIAMTKLGISGMTIVEHAGLYQNPTIMESTIQFIDYLRQLEKNIFVMTHNPTVSQILGQLGCKSFLDPDEVRRGFAVLLEKDKNTWVYTGKYFRP
jgi:phosphohistidine phosphatase SixA